MPATTLPQKLTPEAPGIPRHVYAPRKKERAFLLGSLQRKRIENNIPLIPVFEGRDAAGKGGTIRRLTAKRNPRSYEVVPIAAPSDIERKHHYLRPCAKHATSTRSRNALAATSARDPKELGVSGC
jgi:polyphosphate kinase 2 (PPK2 family)